MNATGNAMSVPCEVVAHHPNRRPPLLHSSLCTLTTDYLQSKWSGLWGGVHLFSVSVVSAALTVVERASSVLTHLMRVRVAVTLNPDPLTQLPVGNAPLRDGEGQSSRVSCLTKNRRGHRVQMASGLLRKGGET